MVEEEEEVEEEEREKEGGRDSVMIDTVPGIY